MTDNSNCDHDATGACGDVCVQEVRITFYPDQLCTSDTVNYDLSLVLDDRIAQGTQNIDLYQRKITIFPYLTSHIFFVRNSKSFVKREHVNLLKSDEL